MVAIVQYRIPCDILVCICAKDDADGRAIRIRLYQFIVHAHIHVHLADILVSYFLGFKIDENEATNQVVIEHEVNEVVFLLRVYMLLPRNKGIAFAKLQEKFLQIVDKRLFKLAFAQ